MGLEHELICVNITDHKHVGGYDNHGLGIFRFGPFRLYDIFNNSSTLRHIYIILINVARYGRCQGSGFGLNDLIWSFKVDVSDSAQRNKLATWVDWLANRFDLAICW